MNEPNDKTAQDPQAPEFSDELARHMVSWAATIDRWTRDGEQCFLVSEEGLRSATSEDVSDAMDRLRHGHPDNPA